MKRVLIFGGVVGTVVALGIFVWGHVSDSALPPAWVHYAWPTDVLLLPFAGDLDVEKGIAALASALLNGVLYALLLGVIYLVVRKRPDANRVA